MADQGSEGLLSPWLRRRRIHAARQYVKGRVLDYGCGSGALAEVVSADRYVGIDVDEPSLKKARDCFARHSFASEPPRTGEKFDTVVSLAVIEHVYDPVKFLRELAGLLMESEDARIVITTPHPSVDWVHDIGASIGIFSKHANEEHEELLDRSALEMAGMHAGLALVSYRRFLLGANQIVVFRRAKGQA